jgi:hypothetical protein
MANLRISDREFQRAIRALENPRRQFLNWAWRAAAGEDKDSYVELLDLMQQLDTLYSSVSRFVGRANGRANGF